MPSAAWAATWRRAAVLVVDLIRGFTDPAFPAGADLGEVVRHTRRVLDAARAAGNPVIHTSIVFTPLHLDHSVWLRKMPAMRGLVEGSPWTLPDERLAVRADEPLLYKQAASAFTGTGLAALLAGLGCDSLIVCGATTSGCVRATVVDACMAGWPTFVPRQCVGDRALAPHEASLFDIQAKYGELIDVEAACALAASTALAARGRHE